MVSLQKQNEESPEILNFWIINFGMSSSVSKYGSDNQYANSMLYLLPHFFSSKSDSSFPFTPMLESDSVLKYLMDEWKEEAVEEEYKNKLYLSRTVKTCCNRNDITTFIKMKIKQLNMSIFTLATNESQFVIKERDIIEELLDKTDDIIIDLTFKYYMYLKQLKELEKEENEYNIKKLNLEKKLNLQSEDILKFASVLYFESNKSICLKKIPQNNTQFARWEKALRDNSVKTFFKELDYEDFQLCEAYRIENSIKLTEFEEKLSKWENAVLKGLFSVISWEQVPNLIVYGISEPKSLDYYDENILRVPQRFIDSWNIPKIVKPLLEKSSSVQLPFHTSIYSTSKMLFDKLNEEPADSGKWYYLLLSRAIVNNNNPVVQEQKPPIEPKAGTKGRKSRIQSAKKATRRREKESCKRQEQNWLWWWTWRLTLRV